MQPLKHQEKFVSNYQGKRLLVHEGGTGKTVCACLWLKDKKATEKTALVVCPKRVVTKWRETLINWGASATVMSKEEFKKNPISAYKYLVIDEADEFASPLFVKGRSQLTEAMYVMIKSFHPEVLLLTATPIRSHPWNLHTLLTFSGFYIDWKKWREHFFELKKLPYLPRPAYIPKSNWRKLIRPVLEKHADIILLKDCIDVPVDPKPAFIKVENPPFENTEWEGSKAFYAEHQHEQKLKAKEIIKEAKVYRKVMVVAHYVEQVEELQKELSKDRETFAIWGKVKNQEAIIKQAQESDECFFIVQASLGAGFDGDQFSALFFASMSYAVRDWVQMKFRVKRIHNLHPVKMVYFIGGRCDKAVYRNVSLGKDFVPSEWQ